jgi:hypothetical protein
VHRRICAVATSSRADGNSSCVGRQAQILPLRWPGAHASRHYARLLSLGVVRHDVYVFEAFERSHRIGSSYQVAVAPDGSTVCALGRNVVLWETRRKRRVASAHPLSRPSYASFSPGGDVLAIKNTGGEVVILNPSDLSIRHRLGGEEFGESCEVIIDAASQFVIDGASGCLRIRGKAPVTGAT